jgi:hypothetical protein
MLDFPNDLGVSNYFMREKDKQLQLLYDEQSSSQQRSHGNARLYKQTSFVVGGGKLQKVFLASKNSFLQFYQV